MLMPALVFLAFVIAYPLSKVFHDSVFYTHLINQDMQGFAGLENFRKVLTDVKFMPALKNTIIWTVFSVAGEYILGLQTAVLLNQKFKGRAILRACVFIPWLVPIIVAGMTWDWMLNPEFGIVNYALKNLGIINKSIDFLGDVRYAMPTVIFVNVWRSFPYYTISILAALQSIPKDLNEAAALDGAGMFKRFTKITMPQLSSISLVLIFMHIIWTSINFDFIWVMTQGGPNYSTETLPVLIYRYSMQKFDAGASSALSTMIFAFMLLLFIVYYRQKSKISENTNL